MLDLLKNITRSMLILPFLTVSTLDAQSNVERSPPSNNQEPYSDGGSLPLRRLALFSSGVGFFEHTGSVSGSVELSLPFNINAVNDALKSLVINDPDSSSTVSYPAEETLPRTLKSLSINLIDNPSIPELLNSLKGAEIEVSIPNPVKGRIMLVEYRPEFGSDRNRRETENEAFLSLFTAQGIRVIRLKEINSFTFSDPKINADLNRALDLITQSRDSETRNLTIKLPGEKTREVSLSYVIPTPIWKVSYRLDLSQEKPFLQGWAIVDNDGDTDWNNVELALVTGRPVSFIQNLYAPYHIFRPTLPLAIAGIAEARTYDSGSPMVMMDMALRSRASPEMQMREEVELEKAYASDTTSASRERAVASAPVPSPNVASGSLETAQGRSAGDQFEFTIKKPVTILRQQSAMLPLVEGAVKAEKMLVFSGSRAGIGRTINPAISAELTNDTGMKLPAGPITVYDGGTYAGDALIEFFPEGEKRIISYGEDLSVTGSVTASNSRNITSVTISKGVMTINQRQSFERFYTFRNAARESKKLILEHPITSGANLITPSSYSEKTNTLYRFTLSLPQGETNFSVKEELPISQTIILSQLNLNSFISYSSNREIPEEVRTALQRAITLRQKIDEERRVLSNLENQRKRLFDEQERTRRNLEVAGNQSQQGQDYLRRLVAQDAEIDDMNSKIASAEQAVQNAQKEYDTYIADLSL